MITCITPTGDRPEALKHCVKWLSSQTYLGAQWIVVDDGEELYKPKIPGPGWALDYVRRTPGEAPSVQSFVHNLQAATPLIQHEKVVIIEDDDFYHPNHLQTMAALLDEYDAAGDERQHYYHLPTQLWVELNNRGSSLAQTGFRRSMLPIFHEALTWALERECRGVDARFWDLLKRKNMNIHLYIDPVTVIGLKGPLGRPGLGVGHRPETSRSPWKSDPDGNKLREWIGDDAVEDLWT
jgi:hypothetical protein